jgi:hypothetical protein
MAAFRDSLDRSVEDVLKKIPGITIKENGGIEVNGKPIQTILVEGSDLFGMDYQLGSKNIRAHDISTVEAIAHYQEDAVLRDVNLSNAVVLNLKLRENKRSIVAGELMGSLGSGRKIKYQFYSPLYRISRKRKTFLLLNSDNLASNIGLSSSNKIVLGDEESLRVKLFREGGFHQLPRVNEAGLPSIFTDNSKTRIGQLREHYTIGKSKLFVKFGGMDQNTSQQKSFHREFLGTESNYTISSTTHWQRKLAELNGQAEYSYTAPNQTFSLRTYVERARETPSFQRTAVGSAPAVDTLRSQVNNELYRVIATKKIFNGYVTQFTLAYQRMRSNESSTFLQEDLNNLFNRTTDILYNQQLNFIQEQLEAEAVLLRKIGKLTFRIGLFAKQEKGHFNNNIVGGVNPSGVELQDYGPLARAVMINGKWLHHLNFTYQVNRQRLDRHDITIRSEKRITPVDILSFQFKHSRGLPNLRMLLTEVTYLSGPFDYFLEPQTMIQGRSYSFTASRNFRNDQRLTSGFLTAFGKSSTNGITDAVSFNGNTTLTRPVADANGFSATLAGGYSFFSLALKSDIKVHFSAKYDNNQYKDGIENIRFQSLNYSFFGETSWLINRRLRLKADIQSGYTNFIGGLSFNNLSGRAATQLILTLKSGRFYMGLYTAGNTGPRAQNSLANGFIGGQKQFKMGKRELALYARWYNPLDRQVLSSQTSTQLYLNESYISTRGSFAYLTVSMGL